jgi:uncharacterized membrane protein
MIADALLAAGFYAHNHVFWTKMLLFAIVAALSAFPTIALIPLCAVFMSRGL